MDCPLAWRGAALALSLLAPAPAHAACLTEAEVAAMVAARDARQPAVTPVGLSAADAACSGQRLNQSLPTQLGKPVGFATEPVWGVLHAPMMLSDGATIWLAQALQKTGQSLAPGDLVGVGSFSKRMPPKPGTAFEVAYWGLPGTPKVKVAFK